MRFMPRMLPSPPGYLAATQSARRLVTSAKLLLDLPK
jgi:hypothetical protein